MKVISLIIFFELFSFFSVEPCKEFICPTTDCDYLFKIEHQHTIPAGTFGSNLFEINKDREIRALINGKISIERQKKSPNYVFSNKVSLKNDQYEISYFTVDSLYVVEGDVVKQGDKIGQVIQRKNLSILILKKGKYFNPKFECD